MHCDIILVDFCILDVRGSVSGSCALYLVITLWLVSAAFPHGLCVCLA